MENFFEVFTTIGSCLASFSVGGIIGFFSKRLTTAARCQIIGVYGVEVPCELQHLPLYTNYRKARHCKYDLCVLICRTLSFPLRKCDFVVTDQGVDPKIVKPDNHARLTAITSCEGIREFEA